MFMLVFRSYKEHWRLWMLKKYGLPFLYWNQMLKGKCSGYCVTLVADTGL